MARIMQYNSIKIRCMDRCAYNITATICFKKSRSNSCVAVIVSSLIWHQQKQIPGLSLRQQLVRVLLSPDLLFALGELQGGCPQH